MGQHLKKALNPQGKLCDITGLIVSLKFHLNQKAFNNRLLL